MNDHKKRMDEAGKRAKKAEVVSSAAVAESSAATGDVPPPSGTAFAVVTANQDADAAEDDVSTACFPHVCSIAVIVCYQALSVRYIGGESETRSHLRSAGGG